MEFSKIPIPDQTYLCEIVSDDKAQNHAIYFLGLEGQLIDYVIVKNAHLNDIVSLLNHTYAGKSGTTDTDNIMVGYNPDIVVSVWTGYDDSRLIEDYDDLSYGKYIWADVIESYMYNKKNSWYEMPSDVIKVDLNPMSGFYPSFNEYHKYIYFKKNNIPWYIELLYKKE